MAVPLAKVFSNESLRIAFIAPLYYTVPPRKYGGTERVVAFLIDQLVGMGHRVTLYGAHGCHTKATLIECLPMTLHDAGITGHIPELQQPYTIQLRRLMSDLTNYDVVHIHHGVFPFHPEIFTKPGPYVWTDHCELHVEGKGDTLQKLHQNANAGATSISNSQRGTLAGAEYWLGTIYHGLPKYLLAPVSVIKPTYLAFLGRLAPEKGAPDAVRISALAGKQLRVAAKLEDIHMTYYNEEVKPIFDKHDVVYIGEITDKNKSEFLSGALALVFPIQWAEPFGLVMIEAMACGTPVIAYNRGSVPEVVDEGVTGFIVNTVEEAAAKVKEAEQLDRKRIREVFEQRFTSTVMAEQYQKLYFRIRDGEAWTKHTGEEDNGGDKEEEDDDHDVIEHVCPGHRHCAEARAKMRKDSAHSSAADELAASFAEMQAVGDCVAK